MHPRIAESLTDELRQADCKHIIDKNFRKSKEKILLVLYLSRNLINMTENQTAKLIQSVSKEDRRQLQNTLASILHDIAMPEDQSLKPTQAETQSADKMLKEGGNESSLVNDPDFIADFENVLSTMPILREIIMNAHHQVQKYLENIVEKLCRTLLSSARYIQLEDMQVQLKLDADRRREQAIREVGRSLIQKINFLSESCESV
jgi:3-methyladenine DNA glycosylase AlkC